MIKKLLLFFTLTFATISYSQETLEKVYAAPNPFTQKTTIYVQSKSAQTVYFSVKNILGRNVHKEKVTLKKGKNSIPFSKNKLRSGLYIYTIKSKKEIVSKRIVIE